MQASNGAALKKNNSPGGGATTTPPPTAGGAPADVIDSVLDSAAAAAAAAAAGVGTAVSAAGAGATATAADDVPQRGTAKWVAALGDVRASCVSVSCVVAVEACLAKFG